MRKRIGPMRRLIGLIGLMGIMSCGGGDDATVQTPPTPPSPPTPTPTETAISFSGAESVEQAVSNGGNRANGTNRRAAGTPLSDITQTFHVWGYKNMDYNDGTGAYGGTQTVFPGYTVNWISGSAATTTTNSNGWEYVAQQTTGDEQTIKYWDMGAKAYRYFAVTGWGGAPPATYDATKAYGTDKTNETNEYEISMLVDASPVMDGGKYKKDATDAKLALAPYFSRLWFSTGNQATYPDKQFGKPVTLEFLKPYARVRFLYKYSTPRQGFKLGVPSFKPTDGSKKIARKGTVTVHYPTEGPEIKEWYKVEPNSDSDPAVNKALEAFTEDFDPDNDTKVYTTCDNGWYWVLPIITQGSYTLTVKVNNSDRSVTVPAQYMQWLPGYSYTYIFKVTEEGGVEIGWVEYAMTPWTDMEVSKTVYNW